MSQNRRFQLQVILLLLICCGVATNTAAFFLAPPVPSRPVRSSSVRRQAKQPTAETEESLLLQELSNEDSQFLRNCQVDLTIRNLFKQLPQLLVKPLSQEDVDKVYSDDVSLTGPRGEELAYGKEELVSLSSTLVAATAAARQANAFATSLTPLITNNTTTNNDIVQCEMALDTSLQSLGVNWTVDLPIGQQVSKLVGLSELVLNEQGKVREHKVLDVQLDGQTVSGLGETLATLRRAVRTFGDSPLLSGLRESPIAATLLSDIRNGLLQQQQATTNETLSVPPLYLVDSVSSTFEANTTKTLIDKLPSTWPPLPGSQRWTTFAASRQAIAKFVEFELPVLSGKEVSTKEDFEKLFAPDVELKGVDGTALASGGERIANFYRTMASLRKGTPSGDWKIRQVSTDYNSSSVIVNWIATNPIRVEGRDRFQLSDDQDEPVIQTIEQLQLKISGNRVNDPEWFRTFLTTIETGRTNVGVDMVVELLQQAGGSPPVKTTTSTLMKGPPKLKQEAAASFYGILCALHRDLPTLTDANPQSPPAAEYVASNIELRGYLDEPLAKGSAAYSQVANVLTASLRTALLTGRVTAEAPPSPRIEFTADGSLRVSLEVKLKAKVTPGDSDLGAVPLRLELVSEYKINSEGKIKEHKLIESRVNGQLTPGDVMSRWIKGTATDEPSPLLDALAWARRFSSSSNSRQ